MQSNNLEDVVLRMCVRVVTAGPYQEDFASLVVASRNGQQEAANENINENAKEKKITND